MSIRRDLVIKVSNGTATLDMPLQIYEKDHGIELRFKLMDYKYKYDKDPENILNSNKEDILEAYTTIVNPSGYELAQINGEVVDDTIKFMIEDSYTDELEELGTYQLQIHVKCTHSEFSIPPVRFEVLERLKGEKVVTDGDDEVDYSDIIDGSTKFVDDETGKLIIQWQKGDTISSVRLNAMVEVINNAVDEEAQRQLNEVEREQQELEREQQELERENRLQAALNSVDARVDESMAEYETRFNALTSSQQQDAEVIDARDGETSLKARLDRDVRNPLQVYEDVEGSYITCDSTDGYAQNVELLGNTIQDADNLADIRSVGDKVEGQELYKIHVLSRRKNLFDFSKLSGGEFTTLNGKYVYKFMDNANYFHYNGSFKENTQYTITLTMLREVRNEPKGLNLKIIYTDGTYKNYALNHGVAQIITSEKGKTIEELSGSHNHSLKAYIDLDSICINEGDIAIDYQSDRLTILSPVQLEKVGDVADRIVCKDGVWGVEKNIGTVVLNGSEGWARYHNMQTYVNCYSAAIPGVYTQVVISNKFKYGKDAWDNVSEDCISGHSDGIIYIVKTDISSASDFKQWLQTNNTIVKFQAKTSQFIPLPHDQQVKLITFAGKTNISFLTEIEGTIKAQVPKSLGATVNSHSEQIDNLSEELDRVKKLEESTVSNVVTESDFTTVEATSNGYFEDVKLEGRTLVNLPTINGVNGKSIITHQYTTSAEVNYLMYTDLDVNKTYTVIIEGDNTNFAFGVCDIVNGVSTNLVPYTHNKVIKFNPISTVGTRIYVRTVVECLGEYTHKIILLEGDHTQNPPSYFEGLMSVGQDVEEVIVESNSNQLFDISKLKEDSVLSIIDNSVIINNYYAYISNLTGKDLGLVKGKTYTLDCESSNTTTDTTASRKIIIRAKDGSHSITVYNREKTTFTVDRDVDDYEVRFYGSANNSGVVEFKNIVISLGEDISNNTKFKQDKKQILYYNPTTQTWEKPILRQWDSIEKHSDGKYYYHKRSGEVVLNGSENWKLALTNSATITVQLPFNKTISPDNNATNIICDKIPVITREEFEANKDNFSLSSNVKIGTPYFVINTYESSLDDFKAWLQANPTTVVYQLAQEEVYECTTIDLLTYADETNLIVKSGALNPKTTLKVHSNVGNVVTLLQKKTLKLEESTIINDRKIAAIETKLEAPAVQVEGSYITCDSTDGYIQNVEILGNTIQDADNLADIRSVGDKVEGQELYEIPVVSVNENLFSGFTQTNSSSLNYYDNDTNTYISSTRIGVESFYIYVEVNGCSMCMNFDSEGTVEIRYKYTNDKQSSFEEAYTNTNYVTQNTVMSNDESCKYLVVTFRTLTENSVAKIRNMSITRNKTVNSYTQHQEHKLTILSPVQLEKVGDVADRIICKDGVWGVEKNIETVIFDGSEDWRTTSILYKDGCQIYHLSEQGVESLNICRSSNYPKNIVSISNRFVSEYRDNVLLEDKPIISREYTLAECISIETSKLSENTVAGFKQWLKENPTIIKYITTQPTFIPLPHDQQIKLRTFAGKTNISFLTEIEGTIKAQIPQSINNTISTHTEQIDNLNKELGKVKKLEESTVSTVVTESDFTTVEATSNGYFEDVKLEGKTLVNLINVPTTFDELDGLRYGNCFRVNLKANTDYTFINMTDKKIQINGASVGAWFELSAGKVDVKSFQSDIDSTKIALIAHSNFGWTTSDADKEMLKQGLIVLEGDHTQNPPEYFEGLMSVGEDVDEMSVESVNENLFNIDDVTKDYYIVSKSGSSFGTLLSSTVSDTSGYIPVSRGVKYIGYYKYDTLLNKTERCYVFYNKNKDIIVDDTDTHKYLPSNSKFEITPSQDGYVRFSYDKNSRDIMFTVENIKDNYINHKQDKKSLLYYNNETETWEKPVLREWDSIEKHSDGKYYYHKRSNEIVLNGSESWILMGYADLENTIGFIHYPSNNIPSITPNIVNYMSDKFISLPNSNWMQDIECCIILNNANIGLKINKSKLSTQDIAGFTAWLQANPTTVVYQLATEEAYECTTIDLLTYADETNYIVNTGTITPKSTLKVICNITNVVRELQQKVSNLENYIQHVMIDALNNALNE